jgi:hypothetical protein
MTSLGPAQHSLPAAPGADLALFDGFPYLVTRVVPALYHFILLRGDASERDLVGLARAQLRANRLDLCLVIGPDSALYIAASGQERADTMPPMGGVPIAGRLRPPIAWPSTPELRDRQQQLQHFVEARAPKTGCMLGDLTKGGRDATADEVARLAGVGSGNMPRGIERCPTCGDWRGECLDTSPTFFCKLVTVHCHCDNHNRCAACGEHLYERRLNANYYNPADGQIWHVPGFSGFAHRCQQTSEAAANDGSL